MATCRECIHYEICKITCCDETVSEELNQALEYMYSPKGCEHYTPKVDYVKRERGEWVFDEDNDFYCSSCNLYPPLMRQTDFCPKCGADMRKEDDNA